MRARILILGHLMAMFAAASWAQPLDPGILVPPERVFCGTQGGRCCDVYRSPSGGVIGPSHCNEGLGCNVATNKCESPCGNPGQVCCDGPETVAPQGGALYRDSSGSFVSRKPMCEASSCDRTKRRCVTDCGKNAGDACCGPQPQLAVASCINPSLACQFADNTWEQGTCQTCGVLGQISCAGHHCSEGLEEDRNGRCVCSLDQFKSAPVTSATSCTNWPERRAHCFSLPPLGRQHSISGSELRPRLMRDEVCVEGAFQVRDGTVLVDVDNPRIWDGSVVIGTARTPTGASFQAFDPLTIISDGQGEPSRGGFFASDTSGSVASVNSTLTRIPSGIGEFGMSATQERIDLLTPGIRVGYSPVTVNIQDVPTDRVPGRSPVTFRMALNPDVLLVPVQVFAVFSDQLSDAADAFSREIALTVFDRGADVGDNKQRFTDGDGRVSLITVPLPHVVLDGDTRPAYAGSHVLPDDILAQCGIQFRLVNYSRLKVANELAAPPPETHPDDIQGAPRALLEEVQRSPVFLDTVLTVMVAPWCADINQKGSWELYPPSGQAIIGKNAVCIRYGAVGADLAHELFHSITSNDHHVDCTRPEYRDNLMCPANGGPTLSSEQCIKARNGLVGSTRLLFPTPQ